MRLLVTSLFLFALVACTGEVSTPATDAATDGPADAGGGGEVTASDPEPPASTDEVPDVEETATVAPSEAAVVPDGLEGYVRPGAEVPPEPDLAEAIRLELGTVLQDVVDSAPPQSTFLLAEGVHRGQAIVLRDGDTLVGEPGAVLNGADVIEDFRQDGAVWVSGGHPDDPQPHGVLDDGWENEANPHDVFVDGRRLRHVLTRDAVGPGTFFFDYEADEIVIGDDPTGVDVELARTQVAVAGPGTSDVLVHRIEVRHYAVPAQRAAVDATDTHEWTIVAVRSMDNHGGGIRLGSGTEVHGCWVEGNGQIGVIGGFQEDLDRPMVVQGCQIVDNGQLGYTWSWEAGATKFFDTHGLVFRNNAVLDNTGPGIWFDTMNTDATIVGNEISGNAINGVFYELSSGALVEDNVITDNGAEGGALAAGIFVANSPGVTVRNNTLSGNTNEVVGVQSYHGDEIDIPRLVEDLQVTGNHITLTDGFVGLSVTTDQTFLYEEGNNRFADNDYVLDGCDPCFIWGDFMELGDWQAVGNDLESTFTTVGD